MPKMKTKSGAKKRFKLTGTGEIEEEERLQAPHPHEEGDQAQTSLTKTSLVHDRDKKGIILLLK
ncbi:MAG: 50S ribosomal protein L35 [Flavobacteriales bacterium]|nr:50S ribosomal protein L35 [Flavobacteriales bacterium]